MQLYRRCNISYLRNLIKLKLVFFFLKVLERKLWQWKTVFTVEELHCVLAGTRCSVPGSFCLRSMYPRNFPHKGAWNFLSLE